MRRLLSIFALVAVLVGCNEPPPEKTVFDAQVGALKKARQVEGQLRQAAEQRRDAETEDRATR